jgi:hypothetical protein
MHDLIVGPSAKRRKIFTSPGSNRTPFGDYRSNQANEETEQLEPETFGHSRHRFFYGWFVVAAAVGMLLGAAPIVWPTNIVSS